MITVLTCVFAKAANFSLIVNLYILFSFPPRRKNERYSVRKRYPHSTSHSMPATTALSCSSIHTRFEETRLGPPRRHVSFKTAARPGAHVLRLQKYQGFLHHELAATLPTADRSPAVGKAHHTEGSTVSANVSGSSSTQHSCPGLTQRTHHIHHVDSPHSAKWR